MWYVVYCCDMASKANTDAEHDNTNHQAVCKAARSAGLSVFEFYASEPYVSALDRNGCPSAAVLTPNETVVIIEYASDNPEYVSDGFAVSTTTATNDHTPEWEMPEDPDRSFDRLDDAVEYAKSQFEVSDK
jgi:hypothetical protein